MKTIKNLSTILVFAVVAFTFTNCSKSDDPTPVQQQQTKTNLEVVKATFAGKWTFKSVTVTQNSSGKSATTSTCERTELASAGFTDTNWKAVSPEPTFTYTSDNQVSVNFPCLAGNPTDSNVKITATQNSDGTVLVNIPSENVSYIVNVSDIKETSIKASLVNTLGYTAILEFTK